MALFSFRTRHKSCIASAVQPMRTECRRLMECARLMYLGNQRNSAEYGSWAAPLRRIGVDATAMTIIL